jgi:small GTP-binding protein
MLKFKIVLAGAKNVGKSSLIARYCDNIFDEHSKKTIGVTFKRKVVRIKENLDVELNIWDFGGEEKYRILFPAYVNGATAALLLYDTTNKKSIDDIENWINVIEDNSKKIIKLTIATKIDLKTERKVSKAEGIQFSKRFDCYGEPIGTSAKTGENVEQAFLLVINAIIEKQLQFCNNCDIYFSKKLKICTSCGTKVLSNEGST